MPVPLHGEREAEVQVLRGFRLALELTLLALVIESVGAYLSHSLSLTVDAVHNIPDSLAFATSWYAVRATEQGATGEFTFGPHRLEVFAGLFNAALVLGTGVAFGLTSALALAHGGVGWGGALDPVWIAVVALPTLGLRSLNLTVLGRVPGRARDLNLRSVMLHLTSDVAIAATLIATSAVLLAIPSAGWADSAAALGIAAVLVYESLPLFRGGWDVLTERTPRSLSVAAIEASARGVPRVLDLHDVHVWAVCPTLICMTAHVRVGDMPLSEAMGVVQTLRDRMVEEFGILHAVFELETSAPTRSGPERGVLGRPAPSS